MINIKTICYYISDYGFGHASRSIAIIRELLKQSANLKVCVCHSYAINFIKESLVDESRVEFREKPTDIGYKLKHNSLEPDINGMINEFKNYIENIDKLIYEELKYCKHKDVNAILSDIVPFSFKLAKDLSIPSIGISNFTWYTAYKQIIDIRELESLKNYYYLMDYYFSLATSKEPNWGIIADKHFGFVSRKCDEKIVKKLRNKIDPSGSKTIVYFGLGMKIFLDQLDNLAIWDSQNCVFIVSNNVVIEKDNVYKIPFNYTESQYFIAASDFVITKAGWSTIAEAINLDKPLIVLNRSNMEEDQNTIQYLRKHQRAEIMDWSELKKFTVNESILQKLYNQKQIHSTNNDSERVAKEILKILS